MPFFDVQCAEHGKQETFSHTPADLRCPLCDTKAKRLWSAPPQFVMEFRYGWDMGAGRNFYSKRERDNWLSENGKRKVRS